MPNDELTFNINAYKEYELANNYYTYLCSQYDYYHTLEIDSLEYWKDDHTLDNQVTYDYARFMAICFKQMRDDYYDNHLRFMRKQSMFAYFVEKEVEKIVGRKKYKEYIEKYANRKTR